MDKRLMPVKRGALRRVLGRWYFALRRQLYWNLPGTRFASAKGGPDDCPCIGFSHRTPLFRKLENLDMELQRNKVRNLVIAASRLDGLLIRPGEVFSFWKLVGRPTAARGFLPGMVLDHGKIRPGMGGGLCQLSNLIYWMTLHTPLTVVERHRHSYDVFPDADRKLPFGSGATCSYPHVDLQVRNDTGETWKLSVRVGEEDLEGEWRTDRPQRYRYEVHEEDHRITREFWGGYVRSNRILRRVYDSRGELLRDEPVTENRALLLYQPKLEA